MPFSIGFWFVVLPQGIFDLLLMDLPTCFYLSAVSVIAISFLFFLLRRRGEREIRASRFWITLISVNVYVLSPTLPVYRSISVYVCALECVFGCLSLLSPLALSVSLAFTHTLSSRFLVPLCQSFCALPYPCFSTLHLTG
jgi:hypothetical protein